MSKLRYPHKGGILILNLKTKNSIVTVISTIVMIMCANCFYTIKSAGNYPLCFLIPLFLVAANIFSLIISKSFESVRIRVANHGVLCLVSFAASSLFSLVYHIYLGIRCIPDDWTTFLWSALICIFVEAVLFWNGIICVYLTSVQLGIKHRIIGILCGMIPIANLIALYSIIKTVSHEVYFETEKALLDKSRKDKKICAVKYPILFVHGVFFRDFKCLNYWGRIPEELIANGAVIYYGNHQSAASVSNSAAELAKRIEQIVTETGCEKVNIIAHSKGGLDCRYAAVKLEMEQYIASITTINTPHHGCEFAEYLLKKIPKRIQTRIETAYNTALKKLGDTNPDFMAAVTDLTASRCEELFSKMRDPKNVFCQSFGSKLNHASGGKFPLNFSYPLVKYFDGANDGLVSERSFSWGEKYRFLTVKGRRGISHGDMIDLNRENIKGFDVREFYVEMVSELRARGL